MNIDIVKALEGADWSEMVRTWLKTEEKVNELILELQNRYIEEDFLRYYATLEDFVSADPEFFMPDILDTQEKAIEFFEANNIKLELE